MSSPNIANFFKAHRKRPRAGKEDGIVPAAKKLKELLKETEQVKQSLKEPEQVKPSLKEPEQVKPSLKEPEQVKQSVKEAAPKALKHREVTVKMQAKSSAQLPAVPAYQRFHSLAQKVPEERAAATAVAKGEPTGKDVQTDLDLPLPFHFKLLKELFVAVETVLGMMQARKETTMFPKVKAAVLTLVRKVSLREKHLAQIATVLPGCYTFGLEKVGKDTHIRIDAEELTPSIVCQRRKAFSEALIKICLEHHSKFLLGLVPPINVPSGKQITRWHPCFKLDQIPDIVAEENILPVKPAYEKPSTARDVIAKAQNILENANPRMKIALQNMLNNSEAEGVQTPQETPAQPKPKSAATIKALKGVSSSLLEKIRNREKEKLLNEMTRSPVESKKLQMLKKLPTFVKIIRNTIVAEKKVALPMNVVIERVSNSIDGMSAGDSDAHIRLLVTVLPHWMKIVKLSHSDMKYLRIDKDVDINKLLQELDQIIKKHSS